MQTIREIAAAVQNVTGAKIPHNDLVLSHLKLVQHQDHTETELKEETDRAFKFLDSKVNLICDNCYWSTGEIDYCISDNLICQSDLIFWLDNTKAVNLINGEIIYNSMQTLKQNEKIICAACQKTVSYNPDQTQTFNTYQKIIIGAEKEDIEIIDQSIETSKNPSLSHQIETLTREQVNEDSSTQTKFIPIRPRKSLTPFRILSHGLGQDSMTEYVLNWEKYDLIIFSDTGNEQNETIQYLDYLVKSMSIEQEARFIILSSNYLGNIYDYYFQKKIVPMVWKNRDCTDKFKIRPIRHFLRGRRSDPAKGGIFDKSCVFEMAIGINYSEADRMRGLPQPENSRLFSTDVKYIFNSYPLVEQKIKRGDEKKILLEAGVLIPVKSGCKICPFTTKKGFDNLKVNDPVGYQQVIDLMKNSTANKDIYNLIESEGLDRFMEWQNKETVNNRCSCMSGQWNESEDPEDEIMVKSNKW